jgi:hypothetical protein
MKQYLISDSLMEDLIKQGVTLSNEKKLLESPEAQFLDLSKVESSVDELGQEWFLKDDLTPIVPDVSALVEALECHAKYDWDGRPLNRAAEALSAYRGGSK